MSELLMIALEQKTRYLYKIWADSREYWIDL